MIGTVLRGRWERAAELRGRRAECGVLDRLAEDVRAGDSRTLVIHGEPGIGKTALLEYLASRVPDGRVLTSAGVQSEQELAFGALHQVCRPLLGRMEALPAPQRNALRITFGFSQGPPPDPFLVGLAILGLLSRAAAERPLVCLIDDAHWFDRASAQLLAFVARRLAAEPVGLLFATRDLNGDLIRLPALELRGLREADAHACSHRPRPGRLTPGSGTRSSPRRAGTPARCSNWPEG
jgi:predicted ATPase